MIVDMPGGMWGEADDNRLAVRNPRYKSLHLRPSCSSYGKTSPRNPQKMPQLQLIQQFQYIQFISCYSVVFMFGTRDCKAVLNIPEAKLGIARTPRATKGKLRLMRTILIQVVGFRLNLLLMI